MNRTSKRKTFGPNRDASISLGKRDANAKEFSTAFEVENSLASIESASKNLVSIRKRNQRKPLFGLRKSRCADFLRQAFSKPLRVFDVDRIA